MISICFVGFASLDVVCDELNDCAWNVGMLQLIDKCVYVFCVESFAHIWCYSDCSRRGTIWLNSFATVLFAGCSAVTVECCILYPCCVRVFCMFVVM